MSSAPARPYVSNGQVLQRFYSYPHSLTPSSSSPPPPSLPPFSKLSKEKSSSISPSLKLKQSSSNSDSYTNANSAENPLSPPLPTRIRNFVNGTYDFFGLYFSSLLSVRILISLPLFRDPIPPILPSPRSNPTRRQTTINTTALTHSQSPLHLSHQKARPLHSSRILFIQYSESLARCQSWCFCYY